MNDDTMHRMKKVIRKRPLRDPNAAREDLEYWLSRPLEERVAAVDLLRAQMYGTGHKLQKVARLVRRRRTGSQ